MTGPRDTPPSWGCVLGPACSPASGSVGVCRSGPQRSTSTRETHTPPNVGYMYMEVIGVGKLSKITVMACAPCFLRRKYYRCLINAGY